MATITPNFNLPSALAELTERTSYEAYLLEAIYSIAANPLLTEGIDDVVFPPDGGPAAQFIHGMASISLGDWRPGFLAVGAPLIAVTAFKLLDMIMEWILTLNGEHKTYRYKAKINILKEPRIAFPPLIQLRPWLHDFLIALYENLEPLRGTIIHNSDFTSTEGTLQVTSTKGATPGPAIIISQSALRNLSVIAVMMVRCLEGNWELDVYSEKRIRYLLDSLAFLHGRPPLGQLEPTYKRLRVYVLDEDPIEIDLRHIVEMAAWGRVNQDVVYDLRIVAVSSEGNSMTVYQIKYEELQKLGSRLLATRAQLDKSVDPILEQINLKNIAQQLTMRKA